MCARTKTGRYKSSQKNTLLHEKGAPKQMGNCGKLNQEESICPFEIGLGFTNILHVSFGQIQSV
jgi:hypothetical protein